MKDLPQWIQGCWHFCAFTGLAFWSNVLLKLMEAYA